MRLETAMLAAQKAPRKVLELKSLRRRRIDRNYQLLLNEAGRRLHRALERGIE
jgi:hypothetical protein